MFECGLLFGETQRAVQQHGVGLIHGPQHRFNSVPAQLLQRGDPLMAIDDYVALCLLFRHHHDRRLLATLGERSEQMALPGRMVHAKMLPMPFELMKLQLHQTG